MAPISEVGPGDETLDRLGGLRVDDVLVAGLVNIDGAARRTLLRSGEG